MAAPGPSASIPRKLILFVIGKHLSPGEAFLILYPQIKDKNLLGCCENLINFLRIAATLKTSAAKYAIVHKTAGVTNMSFDLALQTYMHELVLMWDLPDITPQVSTDLYQDQVARMTAVTENSVSTITTSMTVLMDQQAKATKPKVLTDIYQGSTMARLLVFTAAKSGDTAPNVYHQLAVKMKRQTDQEIVQNCIDKAAAANGRPKGG